MHIFTNLKNFLYDNDNFIAIVNDKIYLYNISKILTLKDDIIIVYFNNKKVEIKGKKLVPIRSINKELEIKGIIESVKIYE
ncbi:MAG: hypothetical protein IJ572_01110 [Bacilli bacterium]|nr:hypothetical protein [Bacilli bacterium]